MSSTFNLFTTQKQSLQLSLKLWLPLLQAQVQDLETIFKEHSFDNPFLEYKSSFESNYSSLSTFDNKSSFIENMSLYKESLYDTVLNQIDAPLFPTPSSQKVAHEILQNINSDGYFEGDIEQIAITCNTTNQFVESVRQRFSYLEPSGIGSLDMIESFKFQLSQLFIDDELNLFVQKIIQNLKQIDKYHKHHRFLEATEIVKRFKYPPAIDFQEDSTYIVPDFFVDVGDDISVKINQSYYPDIIIKDPFKTKNSELKDKLKEARDLVNLLELRKSTLYKLVLIIVEKQMGFFVGSELKPMTMAQVADEIGFEESTISRAVSNKYIKCERGMFSLKSFFTNAVSKNLSSAEIKNYLQNLIENENHEEPLTDQDLVDMVMQRYNMQMVRRTITKYRKLLNVPSSKERKKIYKVRD
ncbi:RNA polymerase factor sigma-54 [Candidatus Sulfurimonas marisnigri]|uniref:RNA polymerase factor sigma-54 n=1 Tax=Candidatus Sulfurimonas marisnigri TaxID=2740405 RepID=A0A7S7RPP2_9BACT|nr:RNA polymerase factor sigma-54 [Candidatus Sulfurimonas marisnigri]QOY53816.1 RNA polymerase factor sigma-54 [Candidatus Sulfurimonas marisnigri]